MDNFSQEYLSQITRKRDYLAQVLTQTRQRINHKSWFVTSTWGVPATLAAQSRLVEDIVRLDIEIDFLVGFLKG